MGGTRMMDRPPWQKVLLGIGIVVQFGLLAVALWDIRRRSADQIRGPKKMWVPVLFVNYVGPIAYLAYGRRKDG